MGMPAEVNFEEMAKESEKKVTAEKKPSVMTGELKGVSSKEGK